MVRPILPGAGAPRLALAFGWGESGGSTSVVGVALPSVAGIGGSGSRFGCGPSPVIVVELIGGTGLAKILVLEAIAAGMHVVTANKALLAIHGTEIFAAAGFTMSRLVIDACSGAPAAQRLNSVERA